MLYELFPELLVSNAAKTLKQKGELFMEEPDCEKVEKRTKVYNTSKKIL
jgi:uncharacterized C2H2 Zn-finger protein